jgi:hypothetical protein
MRATVQPGYAPRIDRSRRQLSGLLAAALACLGLALAAPWAMADQPTAQRPTAQTGAATVSGPASATLAGVVDPNGTDTWYFFVYGVDRYDSQTPLARAGAGVDPVAVSAAVAGLTPGATYHVRLIAFSHRGFARGDDVPFTTVVPVVPTLPPPPTPSTGGSGIPAAPPVLGQTVNVDVRSGTVTVKVPGASGYAALTDLTSLPVGSMLDTREGGVTLNTALPGGKTQSAIFHGGLFEVRQPQGAGGLTEVVLRGALTGCSSSGAGRAAAVSRKKKRKPPRRLWGSDSRGQFRTRGGNSVATVRGTAWYVEDRCDGTLTRVSKGSVSVYDRGRHRTVVVRAGHSYLAHSIR